jgi:ankyrin repeat protein
VSMKKSKFILCLLVLVVATLFSSIALAAGTLSRADELLLMGIRNNDIQMVRTALNNGADVNSKDNCGNTPLTHAVRSECAVFPHSARNNTIVELLLQKGADPNAMRNAGFTIFADAACSNNYPLTRLLLSYGGNPNVMMPVGLSKLPLMFNVMRNYVINSDNKDFQQLVNEMLKKGADIKCTKVGYDFGIDKMNLLMFIAGLTDINTPSRARAMNLIIANGVDPNYTAYSSTFKKNVTALDIAIKQNNRGTVNFLMPLTK